jgi:hypothetical protein
VLAQVLAKEVPQPVGGWSVQAVDDRRVEWAWLGNALACPCADQSGELTISIGGFKIFYSFTYFNANISVN